jgi:hypothetical protein
MPRFLVQLLALLIALHAPFAAAKVSDASCGDGEAAMQRVTTCPDCPGLVMPDPANGDSGCPIGGMAVGQCIAACAGMSGLLSQPSLTVQHAAGGPVAGAPCERYVSLARGCPKPPPRISL